jgi:predicted O-methyltransferase YrrM
MTRSSLVLDERLQAYLRAHSVREPPLLGRLREETAKLPEAGMQIAPEQGQLMALLAELVGARRAIEVGTFTGYSALWVAAALPPDGRLVACDLNETWTAIARRYWHEAGLADRIELRLGPAGASLDALLAEGGADRYDFAFVDADKTGYLGYYEQLLRLVRPGGLIAFDNTLWSGRVADPEAGDADTRALRELNDRLHGDQRISLSLLPIGDGLSLARRR